MTVPNDEYNGLHVGRSVIKQASDLFFREQNVDEISDRFTPPTTQAIKTSVKIALSKPFNRIVEYVCIVPIKNAALKKNLEDLKAECTKLARKPANPITDDNWDFLTKY